jgi:catechol 2,3-dioxygenase-like lactoylglutathione lyase family enzyme
MLRPISSLDTIGRREAEGESVTKKRTHEPWMPADEYGRSLTYFTVNLIVKDLPRSVAFYRDVLGATVEYEDPDFVALALETLSFMLHAEHAYDHHPIYERLLSTTERGTGAELRVLGINPDAVEARARARSGTIIQSATDKPHGWREMMVADPDGYVWAIGVPIPKLS